MSTANAGVMMERVLDLPTVAKVQTDSPPRLTELERLRSALVGQGAHQSKPDAERLSRSWFRSILRLHLEAASRDDYTALVGAEDLLRDVHASLRSSEASASKDAWIEWVRSAMELNSIAVERARADADASWIVPGSLVEKSLLFLQTLPGSSNKEIGRGCGVTGDASSSVSRALRKQRVRGLVVRTRVGVSARWQLTPRGRAVAKKVRARHERELETSAGRATNYARNESVANVIARIDAELEIRDVAPRRKTLDVTQLRSNKYPRLIDPVPLFQIDAFANTFNVPTNPRPLSTSRSMSGGDGA